MGIVEDFHRLMHPELYEEEEAKQKAINEEVELHRSRMHEQIRQSELVGKRSTYCLNLSKAILTECTARLYIKSIDGIIDNPQQYESTLMPAARKTIVESLSTIDTVEKFNELIEHASPYIRSMKPLFEEVAATKTDKDAEAYDGKVFLDKDDIKLIDKWENDNGKDVYAGVLADRIVDVYKDEQEASQEQQEKVQNIVSELQGIEQPVEDEGEVVPGEPNGIPTPDVQNNLDAQEAENAPIEGKDEQLTPEENAVRESVEAGIHILNDAGPRSIFNAIYINKSKAILSEAATADVTNYTEDIFCETICTYALLECIHSMGIKTYSREEKERLKYEFVVAGL